ncbi:hypothetical protein DY251_00945 [Mesorhizobium denitrificans]|uniref:Copper oxidase n=1 Tax=Mesorhizobium denitrificans TaxID=2294114 RepID=A0A371XJW9_9HYPH|nr:hypothetical protein DY251_00945 [Mesorhizobium denitrificans]
MPASAAAKTEPKPLEPASENWCSALPVSGTARRTICADIVALDQALIYNRFGSFNPFGMMFALRRDVVSSERMPEAYTADACGDLVGTETYDGALEAGKVRLKDCKRPRPMVLRTNVGDILHVRLTNLLRPEQPGLTETFCRQGGVNRQAGFKDGGLFNMLRNWVSSGPDDRIAHDDAMCATDSDLKEQASPETPDLDWPRSRGLNFSVQGLTSVDETGTVSENINRACTGLAAIRPGDTIDCYYLIDREGPYFVASNAAPAGGEGDGGSITHGLFGAVVAEQSGTSWFRSQMSAGAFKALWKPKREDDAQAPRHAIGPADLQSSYVTYDSLPGADEAHSSILSMLRKGGGNSFEIIHSDLNAIIYRKAGGARPEINFREFSVFFHDELKSFVTRNFEELSRFGEGQLAGVRDGFAINYGSSGMGALLLANRKGIGPAANCKECLYEEFFLTSWANGDPALLEQYSDDPSNVHHSYLNDRIVFRNFHAGPKETHVFHLHAHQWFAGNDPNRGTYLDSQTVGPQQGFTYNIYGGGLSVYHKGENGKPGWYETLGSGNRNRTLGDSIFHCHLYPHFAQGMWELWRVHDVLEDGTRKLPDGQKAAGLSVEEAADSDKSLKRPGSVDPVTGAWIEPDAAGTGRDVGTPIPALVPLPGHAWPLLPTYNGETTLAASRQSTLPNGEISSMPGYPFYIAGKPGHRPPQAPNDIAKAMPDDGGTSAFLDGGLPRHVLTDDAERKPDFSLPASFPEPLTGASRATRERQQSQVVAKALALGDMTMHLEKAKIDVLPYEGTALEKSGMAFHHDGKVGAGALKLFAADGSPAAFDTAQGGYRSLVSGGLGGYFAVNGAPPKPGAPFADPCGAPDGFANARAVTNGGVKKYVFSKSVNGTDTQFDLMAPTGDTVPTQPSDLKLATDAEISNWVHWWRTDPVLDEQGEPMDRAKRPGLYYVENGNVTTFDAPGQIVLAEVDPLVDDGSGTAVFSTDPGVVGFRRYKGSAVQLDLVTNRAGWHDPQARINVLTKNSDHYKVGQGRISPRISASEEPFFFRALSGECIEYRHTNELPKDLALDDFQVKTPTDTIGQHIHLVKFDVTSSDGSGNGFNYEDGTLAADEIATRICAAKNHDPADVVSSRAPGEAKMHEFAGLCTQDAEGHWIVSDQFKNKIWKLKLSEYRDLFQTTVQRWFADPILSATNIQGDGAADRTLKTVFSHDHFGPSSIQQHGFYTALVIEPQGSATCRTGRKYTAPDGTQVEGNEAECSEPRKDRGLVNADDIDVGVARVILDPDSLDPQSTNYREFALAIADFSTLYDPRDRASKADLLNAMKDRPSDAPATAEVDEEVAGIDGMATLLCEAKYAIAGQPGNMRSFCASVLERDATGWFARAGDAPPAWQAAGQPGDSAGHRSGLQQLLQPAEILALQDYMLGYRAHAAGYPSADGEGARLAKAVAAPRRPESISVDHHDPYMVNYRGEPIPLRVGQSRSGGSDCVLKPLDHWVGALASGVSERCSIDMQSAGIAGDMASVFQSAVHGDPVTPVMETYTSDRVLFRLIQGAQEVQHNFTLEGYNWSRDIDQKFPASMLPLEDISAPNTLLKACQNEMIPATTTTVVRAGRADQYARWVRDGLDGFTDPADHAFWQAYEALIANCFNMSGQIAAQEIGISEHFELAGTYRNDTSGTERIRREGITSMLFPRDNNAGVAELSAVVSAINDNTPTDTLQHFGSVDSLWNGAWGLLRVYKNEDSADGRLVGDCVKNPDATTETGRKALSDCLEGLGRVGDRIQELSSYPALRLEHSLVRISDAQHQQRAVKTEAMTCKYDAPIVHATAVAIEARSVFGKNGIFGDEGTMYGRGVYDRNGLFFALLDTRAIASATGRSDEAYLSDPRLWGNVPLSRVANAIKAAYNRPEPFVLTVNAGDCVRLTIVNALSNYGGQRGLKDDLGDARMPKIVPLNTEPDWSAGEPYLAADLGQHAEEHNMPLRYKQTDADQVRGSARLSVLLPLPVLNYQQRVARPFGYNATGTLAPGSTLLSADDGLTLWGDRSGQIEQMTFYAGRIGTPTGFDVAELLSNGAGGTPYFGAFVAQVSELLRSTLGLSGSGPMPVQVHEVSSNATLGADALPLFYGGRAFTINVKLNPADAGFPELGSAVSATNAAAMTTLKPQIEALWQDYAELVVSSRLHFIPYAFGTLPMKSAGDVIGHPLHGLFGAVNVVPRSADRSAELAVIGERNAGALMQPACAAARNDDPRACTVFAVKPRNIAQADSTPGWQTVSQMSYPADTAPHKVREFTLFWQDGLNLRDRATADRFTPLGPVGSPRLMADCKICDDSYDLGDEAVNYRNAADNIRLRSEPDRGGGRSAESHFDLNGYEFGPEFFALRPDEIGAGKTPQAHVLRAEAGEEVVVHVVHPGGRARQRAFITIGQDYDDLFPGFGFPHAALIGPGKAMNAWLTKKMEPGCYLWHDGPTHLWAGGVWGLLDVVAPGKLNDRTVTSCARRGVASAGN